MQNTQVSFEPLPTRVVVAQVLLIIEALANLALIGLTLVLPGSDLPIFDISGGAISLLLTLVLAWKLGQKRRWAYLTTLIISLITALGLPVLILISSYPFVIQLINLTILALALTLLVILSGGSARRFFAKKP